MWTSIVEREALHPRDDDYPDCPRLLNGLWAEDEDEPHCLRCEGSPRLSGLGVVTDFCGVSVQSGRLVAR